MYGITVCQWKNNCIEKELNYLKFDQEPFMLKVGSQFRN